MISMNFCLIFTHSRNESFRFFNVIISLFNVRRFSSMSVIKLALKLQIPITIIKVITNKAADERIFMYWSTLHIQLELSNQRETFNKSVNIYTLFIGKRFQAGKTFMQLTRLGTFVEMNLLSRTKCIWLLKIKHWKGGIIVFEFSLLVNVFFGWCFRCRRWFFHKWFWTRDFRFLFLIRTKLFIGWKKYRQTS